MFEFSSICLSLAAALGQQNIQSRPLNPIVMQEARPAEREAAPAQAPLADVPTMPREDEFHWQNVPPPGTAAPAQDAPVEEIADDEAGLVQQEIELPLPALPAPVEVEEERPAAPAPVQVPAQTQAQFPPPTAPPAGAQATGRRVAAFWMMVPGL